MKPCSIFYYLRTTFECSKRMNLPYVQEIGRLDCYRFNICDCLKHFEKLGYQVSINEINEKVDLLKIYEKSKSKSNKN